MTLADILNQNMKAAMKAKDNATLSTLRLLLSAIKNKQIDVGHVLSDLEIQDVVKTQVKQLKDSVESFAKGNREDMALSARAEIQVLEGFLPAQMSEEELTALLQEVIQENAATKKEEMGKVMGAAMKAVAGRADGTRVKKIIESLLPVLVLVVFGVMVAQHPVFASIPLGDPFSHTTEYSVFFLRLLRVLVLWLGIPAITLILTAGFELATCSSRDEIHHHCLSKMSHGIFASVIIAGVFTFCTVLLQQIS